MSTKNSGYRVVKIKEELHGLVKHKSVDMRISIQEIVERSIIMFLSREKNVKERRKNNG